VRISAQLIHAPTDRHLWSALYDRPLDDAIALQAEIATSVAKEVVAAVTAEESRRLARPGKIDPEAYDLYLRGRFFWAKRTDESLRRALDYFERAIAIEPDFALGYAAMAETYGPLGYVGFMDPREASPKMRAAAERALELEPDLVEGLTALGACAAFHEWNWAEGERYFLRALEVNPNYVVAYMWYGLWLENMGRQTENLRARERAAELDPLGVAAAGLAQALVLNGRAQAAIDLLERRLEIDGANPQFLENLGDAYAAANRYDAAIEAYRIGGDLGGLGYLYAITGRRDDALAVRAELERLGQARYVRPFDVARVEVGLGNNAAALDALEQGLTIRDPALSGIAVDARFAPLRAEPRFVALLEKIGLR
jgi:tetratricopeptide (TPR) repeat protein